ncbi:DNA-processing protein DprA [Solitalea koreensis]|uniref:DNA processing protein n=1 Tax=Solitalea koreensis TaxID=543615 RepID=A0A521D926_9SPHI|nr:DNA-processing protein DprA [Solitalea koreensis]SMO68173.1 DNA processing protein [Solitalea koreensis]
MSKLYQIALTLLPGIGNVSAKNLLSYCGSAEGIFKTKKSQLLKIPGIGEKTIGVILNHKEYLVRAEEELKFVERYKINMLFFSSSSYPTRLKNCSDAPILLYSKGNIDFNRQKIINIVGTRDATAYGKDICRELIADLSKFNPIIVSGLAYGIDIAAHKEALRNNLSTVAVLGHGLDKIYPGGHRSVAEKMLENGGLLTEFMSQTKPDRENFPMRNRIIAGLCDATIVVEAKESGGALITADLANGYNRDVFAFPGNINEPSSSGCNELIKTNRAQLITSAADLEYYLAWEDKKAKKTTQNLLFFDFSSDEKIIYDLICENGPLSIDDLTAKVSISPGNISRSLLNLEFNSLLKQLPGKIFKKYS